MVSLQPPLSPDRRTAILEFENLSKKRKLEEPQTEQFFEKRSKGEGTKSVLDIELQLESPLPLEWQRCLDVQVRTLYMFIDIRLMNCKILLFMMSKLFTSVKCAQARL